MKVVLIRHTSVDVIPGTCYGQTDVPLTDTFPAEAAVVRNAIPDIRFDVVCSSPLTRCRRLAEFCGYPEPLMDDRIKELNFGDWEMMMYDEIDDPNIKNWHTHFVDTPIPGGESFRDIYNRVSSFLDSLKESGAKNVLIFAHGGVLACAQVYAGHTKLKNIFDGLIPFGGMIEINV
ncbi:MAG TPA: alpha-ribazole phosphatase [Bacteroidaceae bacterium]|jgi:alpha-ribazole phosphatase|nr:alpha-ribazole phosphatase [Bacteroidaceae bacterium]MBP8602987.1 alpha-ribazole phosphatase [Bacteroidaceae bacterium]HOD68932.1 alpha-ribazole phosphatase [Bacteroidaceae bacterium]HQL26375.1 alpha-ribazole phosphatase [Bacteroidaceae bacterium]